MSTPSRTWLVGAFAFVISASSVGCKSKSESNVSLERASDAPAVVEIEGSAQLDLGSAKEVEPNNEPAVATPVKLPVAVTGVLTSSRDVDVYKFVADKNGHARVFLRPVDSVDLMVEAELAIDGQQTVLVGDRGPNTAEGLPNLPVKKGETYFVAVKEFVKQPRRKKGKKPKKKGRKPTEKKVREGDSPPYQLEINIEQKPAASEGVERESEPNGTPETAKAIMSGDRPGAYIGWADDVDYYKLSLDGFTEKDLIEISIDGIDGVTLNLQLTDPKREKVLTRKGAKSGPIYVRGLTTSGAEYLMAKVWAKRSHESQRYRFHFATRRLIEGDEVEPNDSAKKATPLGKDGDEEGETKGEIVAGDVDWFVLPRSSKRRAFKVDVEWSGGIRIEIDSIVAGDSLGVMRGDVRDMEVVVEPKARLRLKVTAKGGGEPTDYTLSWKTEEAEAPAPDPTDDADDDGDPFGGLE